MTALLAVTAGPAAAQCPGGWTAFGSSCYRPIQLVQNWSDMRATAMSLAAASGLTGSVISINDAAENAFARALLPNVTFWIGLNDIAVEGTFVWEDGTVLDLSDPTKNFFGAGEPNNSGNEDCVQMRSDDRWNDINCLSGQFGVAEARVVAAVPEPATVALLAGGLAGLAGLRLRRRG